MKDINLVVAGEPTNIKTNFEEIKKEVAEQVAKYSIDVTEDNIPEAKKVMANFNKVKSEISNKYKEFIDKLSAPINQLKNEKKEIENIITDGRQKIANEVARFESEKLKTISQIISSYIVELCNEKGINSELIGLDEFVKLSSVTANGTITKATKDAIDVKIGLVENEILKAKLEAEQKEKERREIAEKARREAEAEYEAKAEREKAKAVEEAKKEALLSGETPKFEVKKTDDGKCIYTVRATFEVKGSAGISHEIIKNQLAEVLKRAGISTCINIEVLNA